MKKVLIIILALLPIAALRAQISGNLFGTPYSFTVPRGAGGGGGGGGNYSVNRSTAASNYVPSPSSSEVITDAYKNEAADFYSKGCKYWNKDWGKAERYFKKASDYNDGNAGYKKAYLDAKGYKEWDEGVKEATAKNWDKAIEYYKEALNSFPDNPTLKDNIIGCSYHKTGEQAEKYFAKKDWISAAAYYNTLMRNFGDNGMETTARFSSSYSEIDKMRKADGAYIKYNSKLDEIKRDLPFVNTSWTY
jgi:tetratricopeptide (TPR) repeat protein